MSDVLRVERLWGVKWMMSQPCLGSGAVMRSAVSEMNLTEAKLQLNMRGRDQRVESLITGENRREVRRVVLMKNELTKHAMQRRRRRRRRRRRKKVTRLDCLLRELAVTHLWRCLSLEAE